MTELNKNMANNVGKKLDTSMKDNNDFNDSISKLLSTMNNDQFINIDKVLKFTGYKNKRTIKDILFNEKYGFVENTDFKIEQFKYHEIT